MTGCQAAGAVIRNSVSRAKALGMAVMQAHAEHRDPIAAVIAVGNGKLIGAGVITDVDQKIERGFLQGTVTITDVATEREIVIDYQNEYLVARVDNKPTVSTPDIIAILDAASGQAITSESLTFGLRVCVVALPCDPVWKTPKGLALVGPRYFGYEFDYSEF